MGKEQILASNELAMNMIKVMNGYSHEHEQAAHGHINIHNGTPEGVNILFNTYPNGDYFCYFIEDNRLQCVGSLDGKIGKLIDLPMSAAQQFQEKLALVKSSMDARNPNCD